jgi:hypothetical protein
MKRFFLTTAILCAFGVSIFSQNTPGRLTLQQCIETGIANNLDVLQTDLQAKQMKLVGNRQSLTGSPL